MLNRTLVLLSLCVLALSGCSPAPRHSLSEEEKTADMYWLFSQFNQNYAPMQYKEKRYGFDIKTLKAKYLQQATATKTNEEFYLLMHRFVGEFRDAHTSSSLLRSGLPSRTLTAYLGFDGERQGTELVITKLLPTIAKDSAYPIAVGDRIVRLDGIPLSEIILKDSILVRNLGKDEANLSYHMPKLFNRTSTAQPLPSKRDAVLTLRREKTEKEKAKDKDPVEKAKKYIEVEVRVPWVVKDFYTFTKEQEEAASKTKKEEKKDDKTVPKKKPTGAMFGALDAEAFFHTAFSCMSGGTDCTPELFKKLSAQVSGNNAWDRFFFVDTMPTWGSKVVSGELARLLHKSETPLESLNKTREVPSGAIFVKGSDTFPTYITAEKVMAPDKKTVKALKYVATMYLPTFSPEGEEDDVVKEVRNTVTTLQSFGVKDLIIDMIGNGGGSLQLGLRVAQMLAPHRLVMPEIQFKVSETWMDQFETSSLQGKSDAEREIARRVFEDLKGFNAQGKPLSDKYNVENLFPYALAEHPKLKENLNIYLLVDEMCASMCDIFTATLKDNRMATVVGQRTMGAGGNVVMHRDAPNSHLVVNQTESLIVRRDGSYVENNGIEADLKLSVSEAAEEYYTAVRDRAIEEILKP